MIMDTVLHKELDHYLGEKGSSLPKIGAAIELKLPDHSAIGMLTQVFEYFIQ